MNILKESLTRDLLSPHGKILVPEVRVRNTRVGHLTKPPDQPRASSPINDHDYVNILKAGLLARNRQSVNCAFLPEAPRKALYIQTPQCQVVNCTVANHALSAIGHSQKKDISPVFVNCFRKKN